MATVINNPSEGSRTDSGVGLVIGVIIALVLIALFFIYALPYIRGAQQPQDNSAKINITVPNPAGGSTGGSQSSPSGY